MADADLQEVFRGHLYECLKHLAERFNRVMPKGKHGAVSAKNPMAEFCGVAVNSVTRWFDGSERAPVGETSLKLMCFLDTNGYRVIELERMARPHRKFAELIGFGLISAQEAIVLLGYVRCRNLYRVLKGEKEPGKDKEAKMWSSWKERKEELEQRKRLSREKFRLAFLDVQPEKESVAEPASPVAHVATHVSWQKVATGLMESLLALFDEGLLNNPSDEELVALQKIAGNTVLQLSMHLSELSSRLFSIQPKGDG